MFGEPEAFFPLADRAATAETVDPSVAKAL
jgi:hypothetical protein